MIYEFFKNKGGEKVNIIFIEYHVTKNNFYKLENYFEKERFG